MRADQFRSTNASLLKAWSPTPKTFLLQRLLQNGCENISPQQRDRRSGHRRSCSMQRSSANISEGPGNNEIDQFCREPSRVSRLSVDDGFLFVMSRCADPALSTDARPTKPTTRCLRSGGGSLSRGQHAQLGSTRRARRHAGSAPKVRK